MRWSERLGLAGCRCVVSRVSSWGVGLILAGWARRDRDVRLVAGGLGGGCVDLHASVRVVVRIFVSGGVGAVELCGGSVAWGVLNFMVFRSPL